MRIRPIDPEELAVFASVSTRAEEVDDVQRYLERLLTNGATHVDWCFVAEHESRLLGRVAYWTLPRVGVPLDLVLLDVPWERDDLGVGTELVRESARIMRGRGAGDLGHVLDLPAQPPQWQHFPERRDELLTRVGFTVIRETLRFAWNAHDPLPARPERLTYRSVLEAGEEAFLEALERVSTGSLDQRDQAERAEHGARQAARNLVGLLQGLEYDPEWWQLAYTQAETLVGLVLPAGTPSWGTIGYIGVIPEQRGRGYIDDLLARGTRVLATDGVARIEADTDVANVPMANAFRRAGYTQFARRREYQWRNAP